MVLLQTEVIVEIGEDDIISENSYPENISS